MRRILPVIIISQLFGTSLWFAGNAIIADITKDLHLGKHFLAHITSAIQFGFITGTLVFAILSISDRFSPSKVFFLSSVVAGVFNLGITMENIGGSEVLFFRFGTGFFLAGIYPVGMKIVSDHYRAGLGKSLGLLVGALVMGTAFPHILNTFVSVVSWTYVLYLTSTLAMVGGFCTLWFVPDGPYRKANNEVKLSDAFKGFTMREFRSVSLGYFGHMWELYTFWAFVPIMLDTYNTAYPGAHLNVSLLSFLIIGSGGIACIVSGTVSQYLGARKVASFALLISCLCCLFSPLFLSSNSVILFLTFLVLWGLVVIADSPLFSTLIAQYAPEESRGSSLTMVNSIGFAITIVSLQSINLLSDSLDTRYIYMVLALGPILGLYALFRKP